MKWSRVRLLGALRTGVALTVVIAMMMALAMFVITGTRQRIVVELLITIGLVVALQSFVGNSGILSFGHVAFFGFSAYATALLVIPPDAKTRLMPDLPAFVANVEMGPSGAMAIAVLVALAVAILTGLTISRMEAVPLTMATLALLVIGHSIFLNWEGVTRGNLGIIGVPDVVGPTAAGTTTILIVWLALLFAASPWGMRLRAVREDAVAAASLGISTHSTLLLGWVVSAGLMGIGGAVWALNNLAFGPDQFYFAHTFTLLAILLIGGMRSVTGAVVGAIAVTVLSEVLRGVEDGFTLGGWVVDEVPGLIQLAVALLILLTLILRPDGLTRGREILGGER